MIIRLSLVFVRLFAIYFFLSTMHFLPSAVLSISSSTASGFDSLALTVFAQLFASVLLFSYPRVVLVGLRFPKDEHDAGALLSHSLQAAGVALIGLAFTIYGLQGLVNYQFLQSLMADYGFGATNVPVSEIAAFWSSLFEVVAGLILIATSGGISNVFNWLRQLKPRVDEP